MTIITAKDVAALLKIKLSTVYAWAEQKKIPCCKINGVLRFVEEDIKPWVSACKSSEEGYNFLAGKRPKQGGII